MKIKGDDLKRLGYKEGKILGMALEASKSFRQVSKNEAPILLKKVKDYPESFLDDPLLKPLALAMIEYAKTPPNRAIPLVPEQPAYSIYGESFIEAGARSQMDLAMRKGATPAGRGVMGFIPGSMAAPGYLVRGRGDENSINSASHGAERLMNRR